MCVRLGFSELYYHGLGHSFPFTNPFYSATFSLSWTMFFSVRTVQCSALIYSTHVTREWQRLIKSKDDRLTTPGLSLLYQGETCSSAPVLQCSSDNTSLSPLTGGARFTEETLLSSPRLIKLFLYEIKLPLRWQGSLISPHNFLHQKLTFSLRNPLCTQPIKLYCKSWLPARL